MTPRTRVLATSFVLSATTLSGAATPPSASPPATAPTAARPTIVRPTAAAPPAQLWRSSCHYCHEGAPFAPPLLGRQLPAALIEATVRSGAPGMPVFHASELSDAEVSALAQWISASPPPAEPTS